MNLFSILIVISTLTTSTPYTPVHDVVSTTTCVDKQKKKRRQITEYALSFIGTAYNSKRYSSSGFDCSGYVQHVYAQHGIALSRSSKSIATQGRKKRKPESGDLAFFKSNNRVNHVGIVLRTDKKGIHVIHSTSSKGVVVTCIEESDYWKSKFAFVKDVL